jgi:hypothetical protein
MDSLRYFIRPKMRSYGTGTTVPYWPILRVHNKEQDEDRHLPFCFKGFNLATASSGFLNTGRKTSIRN